MIKSKIKGINRERIVQKMLKEQGYNCWRLAGSLGKFDLIAVDRDSIRFIQVKSGYCSPAEREKIRIFECPTVATKEIWIFRNKEIKQFIY